MHYTHETQRLLTICEQSNNQMRNIANKQIHDNMSANQEIKTTQLNSIIESNKEHFKSIKTFLNMMKHDIETDNEKN